MLSFKNAPIQRKLMMIILLTSVVVMFMMRGAFFTYEFLTFRRTMVRQISTLGQIVATNSTAALAFENQDDAAEILAALAADRHIVAACLYDRTGHLFSRYPETRSIDDFPAAPGGKGYRFSDSSLAGFEPVVQGKRPLGTLYLEFDLGAVLHEWFWGSFLIACAVMAAVLAVAYWLSKTLQKQISTPILELAETARTVSERRDYSVRSVKHSNDELGLLTDAFNQMLAEVEKLNREMEQRVLDRTAQLEAANKDLESFSYSVSHDLKAPLRHIDGFAQLLGGHLARSLDDKGRRYLDTITTSAKRLGVLIEELLLFSRMGRTALRKVAVDSRALVDEIIGEMHAETQGRQIDWQIGELPTVLADPVMLRQVWSNLLGNAVKYSRNREHAVVKISHHLDSANAHVFSVQDNGAGFDMAYIGKLFGVFQRLHGTTEFEGTGIGLANVRRITERHGGLTWAEGEVDKGATFYFSIPNSNQTTNLNP